MSSTAEYNFSDWYRPVENQLTVEIQQARIDAIKIHLNNDEQSFWLDVVRLYWSIPVKDPANKVAFIKGFKDADPIFPVLGNDNVVKVLAGILLCFRFEVSSELNTLIALSVKNVNFLGQYDATRDLPVSILAEQYLSTATTELRTFKITQHIDEIDELKSRNEEEYVFDRDDNEIVIDSIKAILHTQKVFSEETNILWWLFGESSVSYEVPFKSLGLPKALPIIAKEIFDILEFELGTQKVASIINKAISNILTSKSAKDYSLLDLIVKFDQSELDILFKHYSPETIFTPILSAFYKAKLALKISDLSDIYASEFFSGDLKKTFPAHVITIQILHEYLLLNKMT